MMKEVKIKWEDIIDLPSGWHDVEDVGDHEILHDKNTFTCFTKGYLVDLTEECALVASTVFMDNSQCSNVTRIPRGAIIEIIYENT